MNVARRRTLRLRVDADQVAAANRLRARYETTLRVRFSRSEIVEMLVRNGWDQVTEAGLALKGKGRGVLMKNEKISVRVSAELAREIALMQERVYRETKFRLTKSAAVEALIERGLEAMKADGRADGETSEETAASDFEEDDDNLETMH